MLPLVEHMRMSTVLAAVISTVGLAQPDGGQLPRGSVIQLELPKQSAYAHGTAVLVDRQRHATGLTLYYLTSSQLFAPVGSRVVDEDSDASVRTGVLRIVDDSNEGVALPMSFESPTVGASFTIAGVDSTDHVVALPQRASRVSPTTAIGDRSLPDIVGCIGAPAMIEGRVFGLVTACDVDQPPTVELLAAAQRFLSGKIPILAPNPSATGEEQ